MKKLVSCFAVASLLALGSTAIADLCTIEATPAATLLLPYFEVDIDNPNGVDTFFSINNASAAAALTHVILWGDWSVEALDFNVYLTGYDVQTIGLGLIIRDGVLPVTYFHNSVSNNGPYSDGHVAFPGCDALPYDTPALNQDYIDHLQALLTGQPSDLIGACGGNDFGDNHARGYVTVDVTTACTLLTPCDDGYFHDGSGTPGTGLGAYTNILWGDWYMIDYANNFAQGDNLVHVEAADPADTIGIDAISDGTFYNRCNAPYNGPFADLRESLATTFAVRFYQNAAFTGGTDFLVWKDSQVDNHAGVSCAAGPSWYPLPEAQVVFFDEEENPETVCTISPCPQEDVLFPSETNRVSVADLEVTPESGWVYMNLNANFGQGFSWLQQGWVVAVHSAEGRFSAGLPAIQLDNFCDQSSIIIGESGDEFPYSEPTCNYFTGCGAGAVGVTKSW